MFRLFGHCLYVQEYRGKRHKSRRGYYTVYLLYA